MDANGASARRYMINDPGSHLEAEVIPEKAARPQAKQGVSQQPQDQSTASVKNVSGTTAEEEGGGGHTVMQRDLAYMQRRYRSAFASTSSSEGELTLSGLDARHKNEGP